MSLKNIFIENLCLFKNNLFISSPIIRFHLLKKSDCEVSFYITDTLLLSHEVLSDSFGTPWTDCSLTGPSLCGISQASILEWVAVSFSRGSSWPRGWTHVSCIGRQTLLLSHWGSPILQMCVCVCVCAQSLSRVQFYVSPWTVAVRSPLSMWFSRQEYWRGLPFSSHRDLPNPGIKPMSLALTGKLFFTTSTTWEAH